MHCNFKLDDGKFNIVEQDDQGSVRLQCRVCGRLYPNEKRPLRPLRWINNPKGLGCNADRRAAKMAAAKVRASGAGRKASCPENCLNRAEAHQKGMIAELAAANLKARTPELKEQTGRMLAEARASQIPDESFKAALRLAVAQALADGKSQETGDHLGDGGQIE